MKILGFQLLAVDLGLRTSGFGLPTINMATFDHREGTNHEPPDVFLMTNDFQVGGSEHQFITLARALRPEAFRVQLGCLRRSGAFLERMVEIARFDVGGSFLSLQAQRARMDLVRHLHSRRVVIAQSFDFYSNLLLIPAARWAGVPVVIGSQRQIGDLLTPLQFGVQTAVFHLCDRVVCNSQAAARRLRSAGLPEAKLVILANGLDDQAFAETTPALPRCPGIVRVGMVARMNGPVKNHPLFLRAAARLARNFPRLESVLVGDGPLRPGLEKMAQELGLGDRARFIGDRRDIPEVLAALDISVLPSYSESLSNAIIESMAAGLAIVATRVGGNPELISDGETGLLVPPDDEDGLVTALHRLISQPSLRAECGRRAKAFALAHFRMDRVRDAYEQLYTTLLQEKGWRPGEWSRHGSNIRPSWTRIRSWVSSVLVRPGQGR